MSIASRVCPKCGAAIPAEAPQGLCPNCLLSQASIPTEQGQGPRSNPPPSCEELAKAFPNLEVLELIGQGGMGFVFKARQPKLDRFVALKILPQSLAADAAFAERFTREGRLLARLNHPNIVTVHDFGRANGFFYLLMEYVDGVNLRQAMRAGQFTPAQALAVVPKICEALQFAHNEGILHRDIKPENILLDTRGRIKMADFGIAKLVDDPRADASLTGSGAHLGTAHYMAPEQIEHPSQVDHRADIYSLGVVFYEMLTGELPIGRFAPPSQRSATDPRLDDVVLRTLEKEPQRRQQSAGEVKTQVETIASSPTPSAPTTVAPRRDHTILGIPLPPVVTVSFAIALFLALAGVTRFTQWFGTDEQFYLTLAGLIPGLAAIAWRWRESRQPESREAVSPMPNWALRASLLFLLAGGVALLYPWLTLRSNQFTWHIASSLVFTGVAVLTREIYWQVIALCWNWLIVICIGLISLKSLQHVLPFAGGGPFGAEFKPHILFLVFFVGIIQMLGALAGLLLLTKEKVKLAFLRRLPSWPKVILAAAVSVLIFVGPWVNWQVVRSGFAKGPAPENPQAIVTGNPRSANTRTIVLGGASSTNTWVSLHCNSPMAPGETLKAMTRLPDGNLVPGSTTFIVHRRLQGRSSYSGMGWFFPSGFTSNDFENAVMQMRLNVVDRPIVIRQGEPLEVFKVRNQYGAVVSGHIEFDKVTPLVSDSNERIRAIVHLRPNPGNIVYYSADVPHGYFLQAMATASDNSDVQATTVISSNDRHSSWFFPGHLFEYSEPQQSHWQLRELAAAGPFEVFLDEPRLLFSVTNKNGLVYRGYFELIAPP